MRKKGSFLAAFFLTGICQRIGLGGDLQVVVGDVSVDLRGVQVVVSQHLLEGAHVHAVLQHQRGRRVAELVGGVLAGVQTGGE